MAFLKAPFGSQKNVLVSVDLLTKNACIKPDPGKVQCPGNQLINLSM